MDENPEIDKDDDELPALPDDVADAWAAVLIDVHEKLKQNARKESADVEEE